MFLISTVLFCILLLFLWREVKPYLERAYPEEQSELEQESDEKETPIPTTLWMVAMNESQEWAREDKLRTMHQMYRESGEDWDVVAHLVSSEGEKK